MDKIAIVLCTKDRPNALNRNLHSLSLTNHNANVYILCDKRGTLEENIKIVEKYNYTAVPHTLDGISRPYNLGIKMGQDDGCSVFVMIDDDLVWEEPAEHIKNNLDDYGYHDTNKEITEFDLNYWPKYLLETLDVDHPERVVFFSKPARASAMAFRQSLLDIFENMNRQLFDDRYASGYWLDDDFYLELAGLSSSQPMRLMEDCIAVVRNWVTHVHTGEGSQWPSDGGENYSVFTSKWIKVDENHPFARQRKAENDFYALREDVEKS